MKLSEITKDEFHQKLVDPIKAEFLKRLEAYKKDAENSGYMVEVFEGPPFTIVTTHIGEEFLSITHITREIQGIARGVGMLDPAFTQPNDIKWTQGSDGAIKIAWEVSFGDTNSTK